MLKLFILARVAADSLRRREEGQTMAEYGIVLAVITIAVIGAITLLADNVRGALENVAGILPGEPKTRRPVLPVNAGTRLHDGGFRRPSARASGGESVKRGEACEV